MTNKEAAAKFPKQTYMVKLTLPGDTFTIVPVSARSAAGAIRAALAWRRNGRDPVIVNAVADAIPAEDSIPSADVRFLEGVAMAARANARAGRKVREAKS
jgi:hypothetical protein